MENHTLDNDIKVFYVTAKSFPDGVLEAHQTLHDKLPQTSGRNFYGLSYSQNGEIIYKAATEELYETEAVIYDCETFTIRKGTYISEYVSNFMDDVQSISRTFEMLLQHPDIDPDGCCVEHYVNDTDVRCMVRLAK